jgi:hypothetical protein
MFYSVGVSPGFWIIFHVITCPVCRLTAAVTVTVRLPVTLYLTEVIRSSCIEPEEDEQEDGETPE